MAVSDIIKKITQIGAAKVAELNAELAQKETDMKAAFAKKETEALAAIAAKAEESKVNLHKKIESLKQKEEKGIMQHAYAAITSKCLGALVQKLEDPKVAEPILKKLVSKLSAKPGKIMANAGFVPLLKKFAPSSLEIQEDPSVMPGFVVAYKDFRIDNQFYTLIHKELKDDLGDAVAAKLDFC